MAKGTGLAVGLAIGLALGVALGNIGVGIALGLAFGIIFDAQQTGKRQKREDGADNAVNAEREVEKDVALEKLLMEVRQKGTITNDEVQAMLHVSDATAERYLQELENRGHIRQIGTVGKTVSYEKI